MKKCNVCGAESYRVESRFCLQCGAVLPDHFEPNQNICTNPSCEWNKSKFIYPDGAKFCDVCGSRTAMSF